MDGITYCLDIKSKRRDFDLDPLIATGSTGAPFRLSLNATTRDAEKRMPTVRITKILMTLPGGEVYDALRGESISVPPENYSPSWVRYQSSGLRLDFADGGEASVELHCVARGRKIVMRKKFVGRNGQRTSLIWDAYWSV